MFKDPGIILIILVVAALVFAIGGYQLVINKYYWGPKGPPNKPKAPGKPRDQT